MNHVEKARSRVIWQYRNAPKLLAWIESLPALAQAEIEQPLQIIADILDIDRRTGAQLDIIGRIVGVERSAQEVQDAFQLGQAEAQLGEPEMLLRAVAETVTEELEDAVYRILIKSKIAKNTADATIDGIVGALGYIVSPNNSITVIDHQDMTFSVSFGSQLTDLERYMLTNFDLLPRPQGVRFIGFTETNAVLRWGGVFARFGDPRARFTGLFVE